MILQFVSSGHMSGSTLTMQSLLGILSVSLSAPPLLPHYLSLIINKNKLEKKPKRTNEQKAESDL